MFFDRQRLSRRDYLALTLAASAEVAAAQQHAHEAAKSPASTKLEVLNRADAADIEALASQIIPSDGSPGAREAGVIFFIDRALATFDADKKDAYRAGLAQVREAAARMFPGAANVAALKSEQQIALIQSIEKSDFFELLRTHTILGFLGSPSYGGNRDLAGWKHIGFEDRMSFEPPFGYYDAQAREEQK